MKMRREERGEVRDLSLQLFFYGRASISPIPFLHMHNTKREKEKRRLAYLW